MPIPWAAPTLSFTHIPSREVGGAQGVDPPLPIFLPRHMYCIPLPKSGGDPGTGWERNVDASCSEEEREGLGEAERQGIGTMRGGSRGSWLFFRGLVSATVCGGHSADSTEALSLTCVTAGMTRPWSSCSSRRPLFLGRVRMAPSFLCLLNLRSYRGNFLLTCNKPTRPPPHLGNDHKCDGRTRLSCKSAAASPGPGQRSLSSVRRSRQLPRSSGPAGTAT